MGRYLVTGRAGSGKSAVAHELRKQGFNAFDTDKVAGLSSWVERTTHKKVVLSEQRFVDTTKYRWIWDKQRMHRLLAQYADIFICGGADNDLTFTGDFDMSFVLDVSPKVQARRLISRTDNDYGKDEKMAKVIIDEQKEHLLKAKASGAFPIDADKPIEEVTTQILEYIHAA